MNRKLKEAKRLKNINMIMLISCILQKQRLKNKVIYYINYLHEITKMAYYSMTFRSDI